MNVWVRSSQRFRRIISSHHNLVSTLSYTWKHVHWCCVLSCNARWTHHSSSLPSTPLFSSTLSWRFSSPPPTCSAWRMVKLLWHREISPNLLLLLLLILGSCVILSCYVMTIYFEKIPFPSRSRISSPMHSLLVSIGSSYRGMRLLSEYLLTGVGNFIEAIMR